MISEKNSQLICTDYSSILLESKVIRKHLIHNISYHLYILGDYLVLSKNERSEQPKYVLPLTYQTSIQWLADQKTHELRELGFEYKNKMKYFEASPIQLNEIKAQLANKVVFYGISVFYSSFSIHQLRLKINEGKKNVSKCINKTILLKEGGYISLYNEIDCLKIMDHPNIIKLLEIFEEEKQFYLMMQHMDGKSLSHKIKEHVRDGFHIKFQEIKEILQNILQGVAYMHSKRIMHRDLKPDNIMYGRCDDTSSLKLVDFGMATSLDCKQVINQKCGTPGYTAPEIINCGRTKYDLVCDIFSVGAIMYKLITLKKLFPGSIQTEIIKLNKSCRINLNILACYRTPKSALDLIQQMLEINPQKRISAQMALQHPFFTDCFNDSIDLSISATEKKYSFQSKKFIDACRPMFFTHDCLSIDDEEVFINDEKTNIAPIPFIDVKNQTQFFESHVMRKDFFPASKSVKTKKSTRGSKIMSLSSFTILKKVVSNRDKATYEVQYPTFNKNSSIIQT